jgi:hypothetical protein
LGEIAQRSPGGGDFTHHTYPVTGITCGGDSGGGINDAAEEKAEDYSRFGGEHVANKILFGIPMRTYNERIRNIRKGLLDCRGGEIRVDMVCYGARRR